MEKKVNHRNVLLGAFPACVSFALGSLSRICGGYLFFPPNSRYIPGRGALLAGIPGSVAGKRLAKEYL
jgi:hypothetical protein